MVWQTSLFGCDYFPVGEIGEDYLVYADSQTTTQLASEGLQATTSDVRVRRRSAGLPL